MSKSIVPNDSDKQKNWVKATSEDLNFNISKALKASDKAITTREQLDDAVKLLAVVIKKHYDNQRLLQRTVYTYFREIRAGADRLGLGTDTVRRIVEETYKQYGVTDAMIKKAIPYEPKDKQANKALSNIKYEGEQEQQIKSELPYDAVATVAPTTTNMQPTAGTATLADPEFNDPSVVLQEPAAGADLLKNDTAIQLSNALERIKLLERENRELNEKLSNSVLIGQEVMVFNGFLPLDDKTHLPLTVAINFREKKMEYADVDTDAIRRAAEDSYKTD